jgi:predicted MPP superfamily phosphohydrolase
MEPLRRAFFRSFFRLLLAAVAVAEWACLAWVLGLLGWRPPAVAWILVPLAILALNRRIVWPRARSPRAARWLRVYAGVAFTSIFCGLFLAAAALTGVLLPDGLARAHEWATNTGVAGIAALFAFGYTAGRRQLVLSRLAIDVPGLPAPFAGLRIVHLSDLHVGSHLGTDELAEHVRRVNALAPDLVCLTGDLVDRAETCARAFPVLAGLRARHGVLVTLGNHDVAAGADAVTAALREHTPFTVLRNARTRLQVGGASLAVVGVDDLGLDWARGVREHPALPALAAGLDGEPWLLLSHRPDCFPQAAGLGASLVLSGHTHGGQLGLPAWRGRRPRNLANFITAFDRGLFGAGTARLYVNQGLGFTGQPIRLFTPREIATIELRPAA